MDAATPEKIAALCAAYIQKSYRHIDPPVLVQIMLGSQFEYLHFGVELLPAVPPDAAPALRGPAAAQDRATSNPAFREVHGNILEALQPPGTRLTGRQLAERAGYTYTGWFRAALSELVHIGKIKNCKPGYELAEAGTGGRPAAAGAGEGSAAAAVTGLPRR